MYHCRRYLLYQNNSFRIDNQICENFLLVMVDKISYKIRFLVR